MRTYRKNKGVKSRAEAQNGFHQTSLRFRFKTNQSSEKPTNPVQKKDKDCSRFFQNKCLLRRILEKPAIAGVQIAVATLSKFSRYLMK